MGPLRTVAEMRRHPWRLRINGIADSKIHAVAMATGEVAVVDGVARTGSGAGWTLVGVRMATASTAGPRRLLPTVTWPDTVHSEDVSTFVPLGLLPWADVRSPVILVAHSAFGDTPPEQGFFGVIDPGVGFAMLPIALGRMRPRMVGVAKALELDSVADVCTYLGEANTNASNRTGSASGEFLSSLETARPAMLKQGLDDAWRSLEWLGLWRPCVNTQAPAHMSRRVSRGLLPAGAWALRECILSYCCRTGSSCNIDATPVKVLDVGSGDGAVVICLGAMGFEARGIELPCPVSCTHNGCPVRTWRKWLEHLGSSHPMLTPLAHRVEQSVLLADATHLSPEVAEWWGWADVVFINNLCFDNELRTMSGRTGSGKCTTNSLMLNALCTAGATNTLVITSRALCHGPKTPANAAGRPYTHGGRQVRSIATHQVPPNGYNWGQPGAPLDLYVHVLEAAGRCSTSTRTGST